MTQGTSSMDQTDSHQKTETIKSINQGAVLHFQLVEYHHPTFGCPLRIIDMMHIPVFDGLKSTLWHSSIHLRFLEDKFQVGFV